MPLRMALLVVGLVLGLGARAAAIDSGGRSLATRTSWGWIYLLVVGWSVMVAAVVVLPERRRSALLLYTTGIWWFVAELAEPSVGVSLAFTIGLALYAAGPALVAHLALSYPTGRLHGWPDLAVVACGYALMVGVLGLIETAMFDPESMGCLDCPNNLLLVSDNPSASDWANPTGVWLGAAWLLIALGAVAWRAVSAGPGARSLIGPIAVPASVLLGANLAQYLADLSSDGSDSGRRGLIVWQLEGVCLVAIAIAMCVDLWRAHRARRDLTRLVVELTGTSPGGLRAALANRLDDRDLLIAYPIQDGRRHVDADARPVDLTPTTARSVTRLVRRDVELATLVHRPGILSQPQERDDLIASVQLALESERLATEDRIQLEEIRTSGTRIVAAGDAERRRIERDLHDGAQQRLVAILLTLRLLREDTADPLLASAETELRGTIADLRQIAHGVYPVLLKDAGLRAALDALTESRRLKIEGETDQRYGELIESTVYLLISRLSTAGPTSVRISRDETHLIVEAFVAAPCTAETDLRDRIETLDGRLDLATDHMATTAKLTLPVERLG